MRLATTLLFALALFVSANNAYRILCVFPFNGRSHFFMFEALCKGLARKGHRVDMISHFPLKKPLANYTDIVDLTGTRRNVVNSFSIDRALGLNIWLTYTVTTDFGNELCHLMGHERMQKFIKNPPKDPPYDLVITEFFGASCYMGFGKLLNAPVALAMSSMDTPHILEILRSPLNYAFFPGIYSKKVVLENFWDRLTNTMRHFIESRHYFYYSSQQTELMRKYLGEDVPDLREIERNISLVLINAHYSLHGIRPITPALVEVGGLHVEGDESELTPELSSWMDAAKNGVVYFSLGSLVNIETLPEDNILGLYASFKKIAPVRVLIKIAEKTKLPAGLPSNVFTLSWIPQIPVLRHKNTRAFITHGGLMGMQEALYYGVPMIGIPLFADQIRNVNAFVHKNMGVSLDIKNITEKSMDAALNAILYDPQYVKSAKRESAKFRDRAVKPLDMAIHAIEYVIRNGPDSLRSPAVDLPWWQLYLIDIFVFLLACLIVTVSAIVFLAKIIYTLLCRASNAYVSSEKKKK